MRRITAIMSTGAARLVDGSTVRLPSRRWYVAGADIEQENHGCPPDVQVEQPPPHDLAKDADTQPVKAVEILLAQLPKDPAQLAW